MQQSIVIGDIHGCAEEFQMLLDELAPTPDIPIYLLGDLINRGPDPHGVLEIARSLPNLRALYGNHELRMLRYYQTKDPQHLKTKDWETLPKLSTNDWDFITHKMEGPVFLAEQKTLLVHGGLLPNIPWQKQSLDVTTRIQVVGKDGKAYKRNKSINSTPWEALWVGPPYVIYGHIPRTNVERRRWSLGIDTGCVLGGHLTACVLPSKEIVQVRALNKYDSKPI